MAKILVFGSDSPEAPSQNDTAIRKAYCDYEAWGMEMCLDLSTCNPHTIRDAETIKRFVRELCTLIKMKRFGDTVVVNFGEDERVAGFSMTQLIETSLISGHFANQNNGAYLNVFSCSPYNPLTVAEFAREFFGAANYSFVCILRKA